MRHVIGDEVYEKCRVCRRVWCGDAPDGICECGEIIED